MSKHIIHVVTTRLDHITSHWTAVCSCGGEAKPSKHKPCVEAWRKSHYVAAARGVTP